MPVIVTDNGKPVAEMVPAVVGGRKSRSRRWARRPLVPAYAKLACKPVGGTDSALIVAEERAR